jgi:aspartate kinase
VLDGLMVVKYGGSVLEDGHAIRRAAESVKDVVEDGGQVVLVASAMKGMTDRLLATAKAISHETPREVVDHIIGLGEEQAVRLMASALRTIGVSAVEVTPDSPSWPIVTDESYGDAEPIMEECVERAELGLKPLIERGVVPVVCGFVGRSIDGNITTLGRGGSDTTAVILARCLDATDLILVKDVGGIFSADPDLVEGAKQIETLSVSDASLLVMSGAEVLHGKVFSYKPDDLKIRIVLIKDPLKDSGSIIRGAIPEIQVSTHDGPVHSITVIGKDVASAGKGALITRAIEDGGGRLHSFKGGRDSAVFWVNGLAGSVLEGVHGLVDSLDCLKAVSVAEDFALIEVRGRRLANVASSIGRLEAKLSECDICIRGLVTGHLAVDMLVDWEERLEASRIVEECFRR